MPQQVLAADDPWAFLGGLVAAVESTLPRPVAQSALTVVRHRSLADRLARRQGSVSSISLATPGHVMELTVAPDSGYSAETRRVMRGIVISRRTQNLGEWLELFASGVAALAGLTMTPQEALRSLGISISRPTIEVGEENTLADLRTLPFKIRGLVPPDASALVERIVELLCDTVPRVVGNGELRVLAERTATVYLPDTLRAYLALPTEWARTHVYPDQSTPDGVLISQLRMLENAAHRMHDAALRGDATGLLINGRLLDYRFGESGLTT
jgi:hypothetical protein